MPKYGNKADTKVDVIVARMLEPTWTSTAMFSRCCRRTDSGTFDRYQYQMFAAAVRLLMARGYLERINTTQPFAYRWSPKRAEFVPQPKGGVA